MWNAFPGRSPVSISSKHPCSNGKLHKKNKHSTTTFNFTYIQSPRTTRICTTLRSFKALSLLIYSFYTSSKSFPPLWVVLHVVHSVYSRIWLLFIHMYALYEYRFQLKTNEFRHYCAWSRNVDLSSFVVPCVNPFIH